MSAKTLVMSLVLFCLAPSFGGLALAQDSAKARAVADPSLRPFLETAYRSWQDATRRQDLRAWEQATALSRQIKTRNRIVSQRLRFPDAMFNDPIAPPPLDGLTHLGILSTGNTATATYFGRANFGGDAAAITENLLVTHFLKEAGQWKFDSLRIVKVSADSDLFARARRGDTSFLSGPEFQPAPSLPPLIEPVLTPDLVTEAWVDATGCEIKLTVNGHPNGTFTNVKRAELVIGGLRKGENQISIEARRLNPSSDAPVKIEVALYASESPTAGARRVFHYRPEGELKKTHRETFIAK